jgi:hypothetical protein
MTPCFLDRRGRWQFAGTARKRGISAIGYSISIFGDAQEGFRLSIDQPNLIP